MKGFLLAGTRSGIGKTTVSMGLMAAFENVSPYKVGPDYIDPSFHEFVTGNRSYNLDLFLMGEEGVKYSFYSHHKGISIVEGVMGLYDGLGNDLNNYSSAHLSKVLSLPVILVVDAIGKSTSIAAEVLGYKLLDPEVNIAGIIINRVSSEKLYSMLKEAVEKYTGIKCLGYLKKDESLNIGSRHLGLLQADEVGDLREKIEHLKNEIKKTVDLAEIYRIANYKVKDYENPFSKFENKYLGIKMGIARDSSFSFYYKDNIELLEKMGIEIVEFSPMRDEKIPENIDILYFGGGYPETYGEILSENKSFLDSLRNFHENGGFIYGECGGFMYLTREIKELDDKSYPMAGLIDCSVKMGKSLQITRFGYVDVEYKSLRGKAHEFHYSRIDEEGEVEKDFILKKIDGRQWNCGYRNKNLLGGYPHLHFYGSIEILIDILEGVKNGIHKKTS